MSDHFEVLMPSMGEGITEATLVKWLKKPGDQVKKEEPLLEVSTDKVDTEIPAPASGKLVATFADAGATIEVNTVIAHIGDAAAATSTGAVKPTAKPTAPAAEPSRAAASAGSGASVAVAAAATAAPNNEARRRASPLVRKIAKATGLDLHAVRGSGAHGRITKRDIEAHQTNPGTARPPSTAAVADTGLVSAPLATKRVGDQELLEGVVVRREKMSKMRVLIAEHMLRSVRTSPHVTTVFEIDLHRIVQLREKRKDAFFRQEGFNLTYTHFFIYSAVQAIKQHPIVNVSVDGYDILWKDHINIGCAVAIDNGLIVPVIKNAGELNLLGVARRLNDLVVRARSKKLTAEDVQGGTFSITNPGMFGSIVSTPIINQPQAAIMSIGAIIKRPVVIDDMIAVRPLVQIGLTFDHRVIDGEGGAKWLATLKHHLESFSDTEI